MVRCTPFLLFDGNCADALSFYHRCLGGELTLTRLADTPMKDQFPPEKHQRIIYGLLKAGDVEFSATDWMASPTREPLLGNMSAMYMIGDEAELRPLFDRLKDGASPDGFVALREMPFGLYGQFYDRFGVQWIFRGNP